MRYEMNLEMNGPVSIVMGNAVGHVTIGARLISSSIFHSTLSRR
jgi:hypothetical protein